MSSAASLEEGGVLLLAVVAGDDGHAGLFHQRLGGVLEAHGADRLGRGADERQAGCGDGFDEGGVFGEEAVAWVDRLRRRCGGSLDDLFGDKIALRGRRRADVDGFVGFGDVQCAPGQRRNRRRRFECRGGGRCE